MDVFKQSGCIRVKVVVLGQKWLLFGQKLMYSGKIVLFGQKGLYSGKSGCIRQKCFNLGKVVVLA